jgi:glycosyltransferase involved in cell wall biosynthesis
MKQKVLIFVVCYNAEAFIESVLNRIPDEVWHNERFDTAVLIIDDESGDKTFERAIDYTHRNRERNITVLHNPANQGYGGNQKIGYHYAIRNQFDVVVLLHGDGQYAPEYLGHMVAPILDGRADVVFGSRMLKKFDALRGKMPLYKWVGNQILTFLQNRILQTRLSEFHTGYRAFRVAALANIPFMHNSNYFDFDTDIIIQLLDTGQRMLEIPIPTFYGDEVSRVNGFRYGALIVRTCLLSRVMRFGIFYHPRFDYAQPDGTFYRPKFGYPSSHQFAVNHVCPDTTVLDIGCGPGFMAQALAGAGARVISLDRTIHPQTARASVQTIAADVEYYDFDGPDAPDGVDTILLLDVLGHLRSPEALLQKLRERYSHDNPDIIITVANVAFFSMRLGLLAGRFHYVRSGILDLEHSRLFTFSSLRRVLLDGGFEIVEERGLPAPFPLAFGKGAGVLLALNSVLIRVSRTTFAYQMAFVVRPKPTLSHLLKNAVESSQQRTIVRQAPPVTVYQ